MGSGACEAVADLRVTSSSTHGVSLAWVGEAGASITVARKSYCGTDDYVTLTTLPAGAAAYTDDTVQSDWVYWYRVTATDHGVSASAAIDVWASLNPEPGGCPGGDLPQASGVSSSACPHGRGDAGPPKDSGAPDGGDGGFTALPATSPGAQVVHPTDDFVSAVESCSTGVVHFAAGTYTVGNEEIDVPSNCQIEGDPSWASIITGGPPGGTVFQLNLSENVTITRLNFQKIAGYAVGNQYGAGIHTGTIKKTRVALNLFEDFTNGPAIWFWDPEDTLIERNAFNAIRGDCIHLYGSDQSGTAFVTDFVHQSATVRWNFSANQNVGASFAAGDFGFSMMEVQASSGSAMIYQNVFYSQSFYTAAAFSLAAGGVPCTGLTSSGQFTGCVAPSYNGGQSGIVADGNIILDNGLGMAGGPELTASQLSVFGGIETMGPTPLVQNNFQRGWGSLSFTAYMFLYDPKTNDYSESANEPVFFQNNTACDVAGGSPESALLVSEQDGHTPENIGSGGNTYAATCAGMAPPALYPQIVAPPDLLDAKGGMFAITNSPIPGPNTYWPDINARVNSAYR